MSHPNVPPSSDASHYFSGSDNKARLEKRKKSATTQATKAAKIRTAAKKRAALQGKPGHPLAELLDEARTGDRRAAARIQAMFGCTWMTLEKRTQAWWPKGIGNT
jgi:hypothetical protein